jgi:hypothetical protein
VSAVHDVSLVPVIWWQINVHATAFFLSLLFLLLLLRSYFPFDNVMQTIKDTLVRAT